jgi:DNA-directed RNA polymerase specialized sigma subunit, sigma24 homolog
MTPRSDELSSPSPKLVPESLHNRLVSTVTRTFGVPEEDARAIVREGCIALYHAKQIAEPDRWLSNFVCDLARAYWHHKPPSDATCREAITVREVTFTRRLLDTLPAPAREALRLRYHEGKTFAEVAEELNVAPLAARRMIEKSLAKIVRAQEANQ